MTTLLIAAMGIAVWAIIIASILKGFWTPARLLRLMIGLAVIGASRAAHIGDWEVWTAFAVIGFLLGELRSRRSNKAQD
ncbi:hypothetical protein HYPP_02986 [Hyphomicrobium sp. ghe19]|nr:hypothetical protein HYPP_02986 [Hyphomicrobium sp. ghe19]